MNELANHLWQSTLFAAGAAMLALALRQHRAQVRYWLWLAASLKFLVPFSAFVALGQAIGWRAALAPVQPFDLTFGLDAAAAPFGPQALAPMPPLMAVRAAGNWLTWLPVAALIVWSSGTCFLLARWLRRWREIRSVARTAELVHDGRELKILRALEASAHAARPTPLHLSDSSLEPGVFGVLKPVLLWPAGVSDRLDDGQIAAILEHEICHVRRRDNLAAFAHSFVEALFWFHPAVWWLGGRLVDERERACDEEVLRRGQRPEVYAAGILRTCEFCLTSPLACLSGVTGSDLKRRLRHILTNGPTRVLTLRHKLLLLTALACTIAGPIAVGVTTAAPVSAHTAALAVPAVQFEAISINRNTSGDPQVRLQVEAGRRLNVVNAPLTALIRMAFQIQPSLLVNAPSWLSTDRFDIVANAAGNPTQPEMMAMTRGLLEQLFKLRTHTESREQQVYSLVMSRNDRELGPRLRVSRIDCRAMRYGPLKPPADGEITCGARVQNGSFRAKGIEMPALANALSRQVGRAVVDQTGLAGAFDLNLEWTPDPNGTIGVTLDNQRENPSMLKAMQEQLALRLEPQQGTVNVLVIDRVEPPPTDDLLKEKRSWQGLARPIRITLSGRRASSAAR